MFILVSLQHNFTEISAVLVYDVFIFWHFIVLKRFSNINYSSDVRFTELGEFWS